MNKILYSALDVQNNKRYGYIEANSNKEVLLLLNKQDFYEINLYGDALFGTQRKDLDHTNAKEQARIAKHDITMMLNPTLLKHMSFGMKNRNNLLFLLLGLVILVIGLFINNTWLITIGSFVSIWIFMNVLLGYVLISDFHELKKAFAYGNWDKAQQKLDTFHNYNENIFPSDFKVQLDKIDAKLLAIKNNPNEALEIVENKYSFLKDISPLQYMILIAEIYALNGEYDEYIKKIQEVYLLHPDNAIAILDLSIAEAYFGDKIKVENLLSNMNENELPIYAIPLVDLLKGIIVKDKNNTEALRYFKTSILKMEVFKSMPEILKNLAIAIGYYSVAAYDDNQKEHANNMLENYWDILKIHGHKYLLEEIYIRMPHFKDVT